MTHVLHFFYPMASATAYGQKLKFFMAEHSATAEGDNYAYGPTLSQNLRLTYKHLILIQTIDSFVLASLSMAFSASSIVCS